MLNAQVKTVRRQRLSLPWGSSLIEVMTAGLIMIPVVFLMIDVAATLMANRSNQEVAQLAARKAANTTTEEAAFRAAQDTVNDWPTSNIVQNLTLASVKFDPVGKLVSVTIEMDASLPVPMPNVKTVHLIAKSEQPIVSLPASI